MCDEKLAAVEKEIAELKSWRDRLQRDADAWAWLCEQSLGIKFFPGESYQSGIERIVKELQRHAIPLATVAAALTELRANYERRANQSNWPDEDDLDWRAAFDLARMELDATIAALDLTADVFDAAIASRPDVLERLADEAVKEKQ